MSAAALLPLGIAAQSPDVNFPTPVETNEINGTIRARDIGDSRVTSYFYTFGGGQGDLFINVVTSNFSGDIDVFAADALRPLTKMVIYPDGGTNETGRLVYLRKGERLILRIEGRSPNDDAAMFRIKFGGSFIALTGQKVEDEPTVAKAAADDSGIKVNSIGTIVAVAPKVKPMPKPVEPEPVNETAAARKPPVKETVVSTVKTKTPPPSGRSSSTEVPTVFGKKKRPPSTEPPTVESASAEPKTEPADNDPKVAGTPEIVPDAASKAAESKTKTISAKAKAPARSKPAKPAPEPVEPKPDPLASIHLVVELKDGNSIERPMSEVQRFSVDKGVLTVIGKDGKISKYSILDVSKVTIQ